MKLETLTDSKHNLDKKKRGTDITACVLESDWGMEIALHMEHIFITYSKL